MSVHRRIADLIPSHGEGQLMTQLGHSAYSWFQPGADIRCHSISYPPQNGGIHLNLLSEFPGPPQGCSSLGGATVAVQRWYDFPEFGSYSGKVNLMFRMRNLGEEVCIVSF